MKRNGGCILLITNICQTLPGLPLKMPPLPQENAGFTYSEVNENHVTIKPLFAAIR